MLELSKGQSIELKKADGSVCTKMRLGAGWDVAEGKTVDLDLWLVPKGGDPVYYNHKSIPGAVLDGDDRTGAGSADGADENITIDVAALAHDEYTVLINIYDAVSKGQFFRDVKRAFVEVECLDTKEKLFNYNITENGGDNFSVVVGKITRANGALSFSAVSEFSTKDAGTLVREVGGNA